MSDVDEEELRRIMDEAATRATDTSGDMPVGTAVNFEPEVAAPPTRMPLGPKVVQVPGARNAADTMTMAPDDLELAAAKVEDRQARSREAFERGTRQLIGGLTRTEPVASQPAVTDAVRQLYARRSQKDAAHNQGEQLRLGAAKVDFERAEAARKAAEGKATDERDFTYRQKHDADVLAQQKDSADANRALTGAGLGIAQRKEAREVGDQPAKASNELRKEFNSLPDVKDFAEVEGSFQKIKSSAQNDSPAGDLALITGFMKIIDPGSSVKEGEFANAQNAGGVEDKIRARYNSIVNGERLSPAQRADFLRQAQALYDVHKGKYEAQAQRYRALAERQRANPDDVIARPKTDGPVPMKFPDGSVYDVDPADMGLAKRKGAVPNG